MPDPLVSDDGFADLGERVRQLALGLTAMLIAMRPYWPSEDASTGTGLTWVLATIVVAALAIIAALLGGTTRFRWSWVDASFLLLVLLVGLSTVVAEDRRSAINLAWEWAGLGVVFLLVRNLPRTRAESATIAGVFVATAVALAAYGLFQAFVELPALKARFLADPAAAMRTVGVVPGTPGEAHFRDRLLNSREAFSTFALANSLAGSLVGPLALVLAVIVDNLRRSGRGSRLVAIALAVLPTSALFLCLLLTKSRSAWIGLFVAALVIAWRARGNLTARTLAIAGVGIVVVLVGVVAGLTRLGQLDKQVLTEATKSLRYRWEYWQATWGVLTNGPIPFEPATPGALQVGEELPIPWPEAHAFWFGLGPGNFAGPYLRHKLPQSSEEIQDPHNMVLDVWSTAGLPAAIVLVVTLGLGVWQALRTRRGEGDEDVSPPSPAKSRRPGAPPVSANWLIPWGAAGWLAVVAFGKLNPFVGDLTTRWVILGAAWAAAIALGGLLWTRRPIPAAGAGVAVLATAINLLAAGGIGMPAVALSLWVLLALGLNLRDDLPCGQLRERPGLVLPALGALAWAGLVGAFAGAIGPFWLSEIALTRGEEAMAKNPPAFEVARGELEEAIQLDKANVIPFVDLAQLELAFWRSPEARTKVNKKDPNRSEVWSRVFIVLDAALKPPWRNPNSLAIRRLQARFARTILREISEPTPLDLVSLHGKLVRAWRKAAQLYPTSADIRAQLALASAEMSLFGDAITEAQAALKLHDLTPHDDKKLPPQVVDELKAKIPIWAEQRDNPPKLPKGA
jgi:O-antigen ligase